MEMKINSVKNLLGDKYNIFKANLKKNDNDDIDKTGQILDNVYQDRNGLYYCVYKPKED